MEFTYALRFRFNATNNEAEYEALISELRIAEQMGVKNLQENVRTLTSSFKVFSIRQVPRSEKKADALSKIASTSFAYLSKQVLVEELKEKSISEVEILAVIEEEGDTWMTPIFEYLTEETLPADVKKERAVRRKSQRFAVLNGTLYKKYFLGPWLRCIGPLQANYELGEIHEGSCGMHAGTRSVVAKALRIAKANSNHVSMAVLQIGIDIAGPFPKGPGKVKFLIVAIDYFTKWIEAKPVATITGNQIKKFVWDNIVCRFGLPGEIILDNGKQFWDNPFKDWCEKLCIRQHFASVKHTQTNGLREQAAIRKAKSKAKMEKYYNSKVQSTSFKPGDLVYRNNDASHAEDTGKLGPKWEGPYEVTKALGKGAYKLRDHDGKQLSRDLECQQPQEVLHSQNVSNSPMRIPQWG
ncbi:reverse transcriptase domain-containing protein [Tanacetum coccineum]